MFDCVQQKRDCLKVHDWQNTFSNTQLVLIISAQQNCKFMILFSSFIKGF